MKFLLKITSVYNEIFPIKKQKCETKICWVLGLPMASKSLPNISNTFIKNCQKIEINETAYKKSKSLVDVGKKRSKMPYYFNLTLKCKNNI